MRRTTDLFRELLEQNQSAEAVKAGSSWHSRATLRALVEKIDGLLTSNGVPAATRVGLVARNRLGHIASLVALLSTNRTVVMLHAYQSAASLADEIKRLDLAAVIADSEDWSKAELADAVRASRALGISCDHTDEPSASVIMANRRVDNASTNGEAADIAIELLTSGTTGTPKRIPISHRTLNQSFADAGLLVGSQQAASGASDDTYIQLYPLGNISGVYGLIVALAQARRVVLLERFSVEGWVKAIKEYRPAIANIPPTAIRMVLDAHIEPEALSSLKILRAGSSPLDPLLQTSFEKKYSLSILTNYGATEFCGVVASWDLNAYLAIGAQKRGSVGRALPGIEMRVRDVESDAILPPNNVGVLELLIPRVRVDWMRTTDLALIDDDGYLYLRGRADGVIIRGGFKVSPEHVASAIRKYPGIHDAVVIGMKDDRLGELPVAAIELDALSSAIDTKDLEKVLRAELASPQVPAHFFFVSALPRTPSLKIDIAELKRMIGV